MKTKRFILLFHPTGKEKSIRIDFESDKPVTDFYEQLKIDGYEIYQFIQDDFKYNMEELELEEKKIEFGKLKREKKTWFGLSKEMVSDLLIYPKKDFFYPYQYGHYFYLYTKRKIEILEFETWLNSTFPYRFDDFDETHAGKNKSEIELMNNDDYLLVTNYDYQKEFGLVGNYRIIKELIEKLRMLKLKSFEEEKFN